MQSATKITPPKSLSLLGACREFFGMKKGQTAIQFGKEYQQLSPDDKKEIQAGLEKNGYKIQVAQPA